MTDDEPKATTDAEAEATSDTKRQASRPKAARKRKTAKKKTRKPKAAAEAPVAPAPPSEGEAEIERAKTPSHLETKVQKELDARAERFSDQDVERLLDREEEVARKADEVPRAFTRVVNQAKLLFEMVRDYATGEYRHVPWYSITMAGAALLYFLDPFDLVPDYIPGIGHVDDALVFALAVRAIKEDLRKYCDYKGYEAAKYFK